MLFAQLIGNERAKTELSSLLRKGVLPPLLLLTGPKGVGKAAFAHAFARAFLSIGEGVHPDLHLYSPEAEGNSYSFESVEQLLKEASLSPSVAKAKLFLLDDAEAMLPSSANALLKTLEEPERGAYFILTTSHPKRLLPTLLSRSWQIPFRQIETSLLEAKLRELRPNLSSEQLTLLSQIAEGSLGKALLLSEEEFFLQTRKVEELLLATERGDWGLYLSLLDQIDRYLAEKENSFGEGLLEWLLQKKREKLLKAPANQFPEALKKFEESLIAAAKALPFADRGVKWKTMLNFTLLGDSSHHEQVPY